MNIPFQTVVVEAPDKATFYEKLYKYLERITDGTMKVEAVQGYPEKAMPDKMNNGEGYIGTFTLSDSDYVAIINTWQDNNFKARLGL